MSEILYNFTDKRKYYRMINPVKVILAGQVYKTIDWSVKAVKIENYDGFLSANEETVAELEINFQNFAIKFQQKIKVLRIDKENKSLVAEFIDPSPRTKEILSYFSNKIITGEFQSVDDVIKHIDIPITDDYLKKIFNNEGSADQFSLFKQCIAMFAYIIFGIVVIAYVFNLVHSKIYMMQIESAVVADNTEVITSPAPGFLSDIYVKKGQSITEGAPLFKVVDTEHEKKIEAKKNEILKNKALLKQKRKMLENIPYAEKLEYLNEELAKITLLYEKKLATKSEINKIKSEIIELKSEVAFLQAEAENLSEIIAINKKDLDFSESTNLQNIIKAPFDGILTAIPAFKNKLVDEKTPVVVIKPNSENKYIKAFLKENQSLKLMVNSRVYIDIPLYNLKLEGKLTEIQKDNNLITAIIEPKNSALLEKTNTNTPVRVSIERKRLFSNLFPNQDNDNDILKKRLSQIFKMPPAPVKTLKSQGLKDKTLPDTAKTQRAFKDAYNAAFLGMCYEMQGNSKCLIEAKKRLLQWAKVNKPTGNPINETNLDGFIFAYNYIKPELTQAEKDLILAWFAKIRDKQSKWKFGPTSGLNNWKTHSLKMLLLIDKALEDEDSFKEHLEQAKEHYKANINEKTGESFDYKQKNNSLWYHTYNFEPWIEIALISGKFDDGIKQQFEFFKKHLKAGESTQPARAIYGYYTLFPEEKNNELLNIAAKKTSIKNDFFKLRAKF